MNLIDKPLTEDQLRAMTSNGVLTVVLSVDLDDLIGFHGIGDMNDWADEKIWRGAGCLSELAYKPVGVFGDAVLIEVTADVRDLLKFLED